MNAAHRALAGMVALFACGTPDVSVELGIPAAVLDQTTWVEIGAFPGGVCPPASELAGGLPGTGMTSRVAFRQTGPALAMGKLDAGAYGFAAVARGDDCGVLAAGCTVVDVTRARDVHVALSVVTPNGATKCGAGSVCNDARCVPPSGVDDPSFGAGCTMELVGAGPLPNPSALGVPQLSQLAVVPLGDGFLVGYTEFVQADGTTELTLFAVDRDGGPLPLPAPQSIDGHCPGAFGDDATGLVLAPLGTGLAVVSRPPCTSKSGFDLFPLSTAGAIVTHNVVSSASAPGPALRLSTHALALSSQPGTYVMTLRIDGQSAIETTDGTTGSAPRTFGAPGDTEARVARTSAVQIVEAQGAMLAAPDAGAPLPGTFARVHLLAASADPTTFSATPDDQVAANVSAVAAVGSRAFVVTDGQGKGVDAFARGYDLGSKGAPVDLGFGISSGTGPILAMDADAHGDRLVLVTERQRSISAVVISGATGSSPQVQTQLAFTDDLRIPQTFQDGSVSVAATDSRVAVAWTSRKLPLSFNDVVGGYAVFACR